MAKKSQLWMVCLASHEICPDKPHSCPEATHWPCAEYRPLASTMDKNTVIMSVQYETSRVYLSLRSDNEMRMSCTLSLSVVDSVNKHISNATETYTLNCVLCSAKFLTRNA